MSQLSDLSLTVEKQTHELEGLSEDVNNCTALVRQAQDALLHLQTNLAQKRTELSHLQTKRDNNLRMIRDLIGIHLGDLDMPLGGLSDHG